MTADEVDAVLGGEKRTTLLVVNSVCGCSAGATRPGEQMSLQIREPGRSCWRR